jgi:hypothetical protein
MRIGRTIIQNGWIPNGFIELLKCAWFSVKIFTPTCGKEKRSSECFHTPCPPMICKFETFN